MLMIFLFIKGQLPTERYSNEILPIMMDSIDITKIVTAPCF